MRDPLFLILSGTYVGADLVSEFGRLPPCFLPNGTQRLFETQLEFARSQSTNIALTLPKDFDLSDFDRSRLSMHGVRVVGVDPQERLTSSLAKALGELDHQGRLLLLFGDTLVAFEDTGSEPDTFASGETHLVAMWADYERDGDQVVFHQAVGAGGNARKVVAGFFDFADAALLQRLAGEKTEFIEVLNGYAAVRSLLPVEAAHWLDFGHLHTYFRSRQNELAARAFNRVESDGLSVRKAGTPPEKILAEAGWYQNLPSRFRPFVPHLIGVQDEPEAAYEIEYLYLPLLSELYCFARLPSQSWGDIFASCRQFLELCHSVRPRLGETINGYPARFFDDMMCGKTFKRLETFAESTGLSLEEAWTLDGVPMPSLAVVAERLIAAIPPTAMEDICLWHGDFHFANIFFDFRSQRVKVVDPRGMLSDGYRTMFGDARYDLAKLAHSVVGMYDFLVAQRFKLSYDGGYRIGLDLEPDEERNRIVADFSAFRIGRYGCGEPEIIAITALLFLSMLPLHADNKELQLAMLANGLRLARLVEAPR